jgi:hypothetical protein
MPAAHLGVCGGVGCQRRTLGFVEGSDASGALGGLWRGRMPAGALEVGCQRRTWGFVEGLDASGALGVRGCQRCTWGFVEVSDASGCTWGFVEGSDASGALGGSWRGRMPAANHNPVCLNYMARRLEERRGT